MSLPRSSHVRGLLHDPAVSLVPAVLFVPAVEEDVLDVTESRFLDGPFPIGVRLCFCVVELSHYTPED